MPASAVTLMGGRRVYVTVLREPIKRVVSEYSFACLTKKRTKRADKFINTPDGPKALLDWSPRLWRVLDHRACHEPSPKQFVDWLKHPDNPAHGRYARFFIPRGKDPNKASLGAPLTTRTHNCLSGDAAATVTHWRRILELKGIAALANLAEITHVMNTDADLGSSAMATLKDRFWFVGILEHLEPSYNAFCELGKFAACGTRPPANAGIEHSSKQSRFSASVEMKDTIAQRNSLDLKLYHTAYKQLGLGKSKK